jgi:uncharacterized ParB-like nuclease family protein
VPRVTNEINLANLIIDKEPIGPKTLELVDHLRAGGDVPPIHVKPNYKGQYLVLNGRHRSLAFKLLGRKTIQASYFISDEPEINKPLSNIAPQFPASIPQADGYSLNVTPHLEE